MSKGSIVRRIAQEDKNAAIRLAFRLLGIDSSVMDGGPGSGNFGHKGRPGKVGGSTEKGYGSPPGSAKSFWEGQPREWTARMKHSLEKLGSHWFSEDPSNDEWEEAERKAIGSGDGDAAYNTYFSEKASESDWYDHVKNGNFDNLTADEAKFVSDMLEKESGKDVEEKEFGFVCMDANDEQKKAYLSLMSKEMGGGYDQGLIDRVVNKIGTKIAVVQNNQSVSSAEDYRNKIGKIMEKHANNKDYSPDELRLAGQLTIAEYERRVNEFETGEKYKQLEKQRDEASEERRKAVEAHREAFRKMIALPKGSPERDEALKEERRLDKELSKAIKKTEGVYLAFNEYRAQKTANCLSDALKEIRGVGVDQTRLENYIETYGSQGMGKAKATFARIINHFPSDWIENSMSAGRLTIEAKSTGGYGNREAFDGTAGHSYIGISRTVSGEDFYGIGACIHEFTHRLELTEPKLNEIEHAFYEKRTKGEEEKSLQEVCRGRGYSADEMTRKDKFPDAYCGKWYGEGDKHLEVLTMGFQWAYTSPDSFKDDREYKELVYGLLTMI